MQCLCIKIHAAKSEGQICAYGAQAASERWWCCRSSVLTSRVDGVGEITESVVDLVMMVMMIVVGRGGGVSGAFGVGW